MSPNPNPSLQISALENFTRWVYVMQQINEAKHYMGHAETLGHPHLLTSYETILDFLAFFRGALNSYAKCFVSTGSGRRKLESSHVFKGDGALAQQHQDIMTLRNRFVAHSDENDIESAEVAQEDVDEELVLRLQYSISFPFDRLYELRDLIRFIELHVVEMQESHLTSISKQLGKPVRVLQGGGNV